MTATQGEVPFLGIWQAPWTPLTTERDPEQPGGAPRAQR
jgi:hypothetical protein